MPIVRSESPELASYIRRVLVVVLIFVVLQWPEQEAEKGHTIGISMNKPVSYPDLEVEILHRLLSSGRRGGGRRGAVEVRSIFVQARIGSGVSGPGVLEVRYPCSSSSCSLCGEGDGGGKLRRPKSSRLGLSSFSAATCWTYGAGCCS